MKEIDSAKTEHANKYDIILLFRIFITGYIKSSYLDERVANGEIQPYSLSSKIFRIKNVFNNTNKNIQKPLVLKFYSHR